MSEVQNDKIRDITRYVKYPRYIRIQRQKAILEQRMKVPPTVNVVRTPVDVNLNKELLTLAGKYQLETKEARKERLAKEAAAPLALTTGINAVTTAVEKKKAKLVLIACDVDPVELVLTLPTLCHKMKIPYAVVRTKALLGQLVHVKTCSCVALTEVSKADEAALKSVVDKIALSTNYKEQMKHYGGNKRSNRSLDKEKLKKGGK